MKYFDKVMFGQKAFIVNDERELLIMRRQKVQMYEEYWDVPGGRAEVGESLEKALKREVLEESGLEITRIVLVLSSCLAEAKTSDAVHFYRNIYLCKAKGKVKLSKEHSEHKWVNVSELENYNFPPDNDYQKTLLLLRDRLSELDTDKTYTKLY